MLICSKVTVPRYKKSSSKDGLPTTLIDFTMLCPGMSQITKNHQLQSYRDVIMGKPFYEICDSNALKIIYEPWALFTADRIEWKNGEMDVPDTPRPENLELTQISLDSEILQTFVETSNISHVDIEQYSYYESEKLEQADFHLQVGSYSYFGSEMDRSERLMPIANYAWTIFTKEGFKKIRDTISIPKKNRKITINHCWGGFGVVHLGKCKYYMCIIFSTFSQNKARWGKENLLVVII